jgi:hypothetical protein
MQPILTNGLPYRFRIISGMAHPNPLLNKDCPKIHKSAKQLKDCEKLATVTLPLL